MIDKKQIIREIEEKFKDAKKEIGFETSLENLDSAFSIKDSVLSNGFVSDNFSRQICSRIAEAYGSWVNYLNNLLIPSSGFIPFQTESKIFSSEQDRKLVWSLIRGAIQLTSLNNLINLNKDKKLEKDFIDSSYKYWVEVFSPSMEKIMQRSHEAWKKD